MEHPQDRAGRPAQPDPEVALVLEWIRRSQRARGSGDAEDFAALRSLLADDVEFRVASPWTDQPWRVAVRGAESAVERLRAPANAAAVLTTETVNAVRAGDDVMVEQVSTIRVGGVDHVTCVCHVFTVREGRIAGVRAYRNDAGLPL